MLKIGLTGGIGSGKTTAANYFKRLGINIIDSDQIARELTAKNQPAYLAIKQKYGSDILNAEDELDRRKLRAIIFNKPLEKLWLENLLHPLIKQEITNRATTIKQPYIIIVIPLLIESNAFDLIDRVLLIDSPIEKQIERVIQRDYLDKSLTLNMIESQTTRERRLAVADDVVHNDDDLDKLKKQIEKLHLRYLQMSQAAT